MVDEQGASVFGPVVPHAERMGRVPEPKLHEMHDYIDGLPADELVRYVHALYAKLQVGGVTDMLPSAVMTEVLPKLGFDWQAHYSQTHVVDFLEYNLGELIFLKQAMTKHGMFREEAERQFPDIDDVVAKLRSVLCVMHSVNRLILVYVRLKCALDELENPTGFDPGNIGRKIGERGVSCQFDDLDKNNDHQELVLHLLNVAYEKGYRKYNGYVFRRVRVAEGSRELLTHAWEEVMSLEDFVRASCLKDVDMRMWRCMTSRCSAAADAAKYLSACMDPELPTLVKDRSVFAFSDGTYLTWVRHDDGSVSDLFVPYRLGPQDRPLHNRVVAANYFEQPMEFMGARHWSDIPTPNLDKILDTQAFAPEVKRWLYVLVGRLLHDLNEHDAWQVIPFLKGVGGCGKSTLINDVCGIFYHKHDIGVLSNNVEKRFGLSALHGKLLFVAPEIKHDLQLDQAEFQCMVSGEELAVAVKHETARSVKWTTPGILAGNELPGWVDNSGSIARRVVVFSFDTHVPATKGDTELKAKLRAEIGRILQKCARAYIEAVQQVGSSNVWLHLPQYFADQQDKLRMDTNSLEHFLGNNVCTFGEAEYMPRDSFMTAYRDYCKTYNLVQKSTNSNALATPFARFGIRQPSERVPRIYPPGSGRVVCTNWLLGVDIKDSMAADTGDGDGF